MAENEVRHGVKAWYLLIASGGIRSTPEED